MKLSEEHRRWFQEAGEMAHQLVNTCVRGQQVRGDSISESLLLIAFIVYGELSIWCVIGDHVLSFTNVFIPANRLTRKSGILGKLADPARLQYGICCALHDKNGELVAGGLRFTSGRT